jgi:purine-binding chemotaxis protein CheW
MDLAKIRKKALEGRPQLSQESSLQDPWAVVAFSDPLENAVDTSFPDDYFQNTSTAPASSTEILHSHAAFINKSENLITVRDPIEIIMAGRSASGCDEEVTLADEEIAVDTVADLEFLCFRVSDELYGINIMDIKEIIKPREVTEVPRAPAFVTGVLSLRGTIIPILDMRMRLGLNREQVSGKERIVVIKNYESFSGLLVDEVIQVVRMKKESVEPAPAVFEGIDRDFIFGIGRTDGRLLIILNLESVADIHLC